VVTPAAGNSQNCPQLGATDGGANLQTWPISADSGAAIGADGGACLPICNGSSITETCNGVNEGYDFTTTYQAMGSASGATGSIMVTVYGPDGGVFFTCSYTFTFTPQ
jgi:hypothetical protein